MAISRTDATLRVPTRALATCVCCGSTRLLRAREYRCVESSFAARVHPSLDVLRCAACGLAQLDHVHLDVRAHADWVAWAYANARGPRTRQSLRWLEARGRALAELSRRHHDGGALRKVFQLGAGPGLDLVAMQHVHRQAECWADRLDAADGPTNLARIGTLAEGPFDRLLMTHVLGQIVDPVPFLRRAIQALRPGGLLIVEAGNDTDAFLDVRESFEPQVTFFTIDSLPKLFSTNFGDDLEPVHLATAGPRAAQVAARPSTGLWDRLLRMIGAAPRLPIDVTDDESARDRAFVRAVFRRLRTTADERGR